MAKSLDEIFTKLYESELRVADEDLPRSIHKRKMQARAEAEASVKLKERTVRETDPGKETVTGNRPLTIEEADVVKQRIDQLRAQIQRIKGKISRYSPLALNVPRKKF